MPKLTPIGEMNLIKEVESLRKELAEADALIKRLEAEVDEANRRAMEEHGQA